MSIQTTHITVEQFVAFAALPENSDRHLEYIGGEIVEMVSNQRSSAIAGEIIFLLKLFLRENNVGGVVTVTDGGYMIAGERYMPDVAYISPEKQAQPSDEAWSTTPPDFVVEVLSPSNTPHETRIKIGNYLAVGSVVWVVDADREVIEIYTPGQPVKAVDRDGVVDGGAVLPGFSVPVKDIFRA